jgi:putative membrane-bound dehydrogenase-like protein
MTSPVRITSICQAGRHALLFLGIGLLIGNGISPTISFADDPKPSAPPVRMIFDTDIESDVDDVGAVALLHALADRGEVEILAMGVSAKHRWSVPCLSALNTYFGRPDIPLGGVKGPGVDEGSKYAEAIAREFPHQIPSADAAPDAAHVYRAVLAAQPDRSVVMVSVGFLTNFRNLLETKPDGHSPLNGRDLVAQKVKTWVCMGGRFPEGKEWNVFRDAEASRVAIEQWPTPILFSGFEVGVEVKTGAGLDKLPKDSPVRRGYELFNNLQDRESWDQTAVLYAVRGLEGGLDHLWKLSPPGRIVLAEDGSNEWEEDEAGSHRYFVPVAPPAEAAEVIEQLMLHQPAAEQDQVEEEQADGGTLYDVGLARVDVTPEYPIRLNGFGFRREESEGVTQQIWAKAMAISRGDQAPVVIVTLDSLGIRESMLDEVIRRVQEKTGVSRGQLVVAFSHSHTTPKVNGACDNIFSRPIPDDHQTRIDRYTDELTDALETVVLEAVADRKPSHLSWSIGTVDFAKNRRTPGGPVDHDLPVLLVKGLEDEIRAVYVSYACHCVTLSHNMISGDWAGYAQEMIERQFPGSLALVAIGAGSDSNPDSGVTGDKVDVAAAQGARIADEVVRCVAEGMRPIRGDVSYQLRHVQLPLQELPAKEVWEERAREETPAGYNAQTQLARLQRGEMLQEEIEYPIQTITFGDDLHMIFLAGEVCVDYSLRLKKELDRDRIWVHGYSNDFCAYIPSERLLREGGYGGGAEIPYFALPAPFRPGLEEKIIQSVRQLTPPYFFAEKSTQGIAPRSPEESLDCLEIPPGMRVELVAAEPMIADPVAIEFGPDGRLWVVEMPDYSREVDEEFRHSGRVRVLEDTNGDGQYDRSTLFVTGLRFPTGAMVWRSGLLVTDAPHILYLEDTTGDGQADSQEIWYSGFATVNPHARVNGLRYGLDNWVYGSGGLFGGDITSFSGQQASLNRRDFRIRPDTGAVEPATGVTQQSRVRDDWGNWFGCDNSNLAWHYPVPDHYVRRNPFVAPPAPRVSVPADAEANRLYPAGDLVMFALSGPPGRATSACGIESYRDVLLGEQYFGDLFTCEPVHQVVHRLTLERTGATFRGHRPPEESDREFLASTDQWFRPVQVRTGPDGALWIVDMYRYVIEHQRWIPDETKAELDLFAGTTRGRIYRLVPEDQPLHEVPNLLPLPSEELVAWLDHPSGVLRDQVQQQLVWRASPENRLSDTVVDRLRQLAAQGEQPAGRLQAFCTLEGIGRLDPSLLVTGLEDPHPAVRRHALRLSEPWLDQQHDLLQAVLERIEDSAYEVRLQAAYTLGESKDPEAARAIADLQLRDGRDPYLSAALRSSVNGDNIVLILETLRDRLDLEPAKRAILSPYIALAVRLGNREAVGQSVEAIAALTSSDSETSGTLSADDLWKLAAVREVLQSVRDSRQTLSDLLTPAQLDQLHKLLHATRSAIEAPDQGIELRIAGLRLLSAADELRAEEDLDLLVAQFEPQHPVPLQQGAVAALAEWSDREAASALLEVAPYVTPQVRHEILDAVLNRPSWVPRLLDAIDRQQIAVSSIDAARRDRLLNHTDESIRVRAAELLATTSNPDRQKLIERYAESLGASADADRGAELFSQKCAACHRVGEIGHDVGPDLSALTQKSPRYLLNAILDPNQEVDERFETYVASHADGRVFTGILVSETSTGITLREQEGRTHELLRENLEQLRATGKSLMPEGLENDLNPTQMAELITYLMERVGASALTTKSGP